MIPAIAALGEALEGAVIDGGQRATGRICLVSPTTTGRWGGDPSAWPLQAAVLLARKRSTVAAAIRAALGDEPAGQQDAAEADARTALRRSAHLIEDLAGALEDQTISVREARHLLGAVADLRATLESLTAGLTARAKERL